MQFSNKLKLRRDVISNIKNNQQAEVIEKGPVGSCFLFSCRLFDDPSSKKQTDEKADIT